jgi:hypothetical protein
MNITQIKHVFITILCVTLTASAVEYKTLKQGETIVTDPNSLIEITAYGSSTLGTLDMQLVDNTPISLSIKSYIAITSGSGSSVSTGVATDSKLGSIVTGVKAITATNTWITVKITPAEATSPTQPSNVAVIPNDANGQYQVILESSVDMVTWNAVNPGNFGGSTPSRFFRTRIVKLP